MLDKFGVGCGTWDSRVVSDGKRFGKIKEVPFLYIIFRKCRYSRKLQDILSYLTLDIRDTERLHSYQTCHTSAIQTTFGNVLGMSLQV